MVLSTFNVSITLKKSKTEENIGKLVDCEEVLLIGSHLKNNLVNSRRKKSYTNQEF